MKYSALVSLVLLLTSCGDQDKPLAADSVQPAVNTKPAVTEVQPYRPDISNMPWEGDLNDAIYWRDSRGENVVLISSKPQYFWADQNPNAKSFFPEGEEEETLSELTEIFATHYVLKRGEAQWKVFNAYHDFLFGCCDVYMNYQPGSLQVTDADADGTGEPLFMFNETEGDGLLDSHFTGTMVYESDSAYYSIQGNTGLGWEIEMNGKSGETADVKKTLPADEMKSLLMNNKWRELYLAKVQQDRDALTEKNNVQEDGHTDHQH